MAESAGRALIVTLGRARGSLAAARALHAAGWTVGIGTPTGDGMVTASRACAHRHRIPRPRGDGREFAEGVRRAVEEAAYDVVFGGADDWMAALATYCDELPARVAHPQAEVVAAALDKLELADRAAAAGIAAPRTMAADAESVQRWRGPVVVKCRSHWFPGQRRGQRIEARWFPDVRAAQARIAMIRRHGFEPILQEPVAGRLGALIGLMHEGRLLGRVQQVSEGLWPTPSGVSSRAATVAVDTSLAQRCEVLLKELDWTGLVELQFLHGDDDRPRLIDLNGRFFGSMALTVGAGANLPDAWGRQVLDRSLPPLPDAPPDVRFVWLAGDLRRAVAERRGGLLGDLRSTWRFSRGAVRSVWDPSDTGPTVDLLRARTRRLASRADP